MSTVQLTEVQQILLNECDGGPGMSVEWEADAI